jgi:hypothetical protein
LERQPAATIATAASRVDNVKRTFIRLFLSRKRAGCVSTERWFVKSSVGLPDDEKISTIAS